VSGFLVSTVGQKIYIWQFKDRDLHGIAFIDAQIYCHQVYLTLLHTRMQTFFAILFRFRFLSSYTN
jgi:hypothetical protein